MSSSPAAMLQALMRAAEGDPEARNQALGLLRRASLLASTWPTDAQQIRTLTNSEGLTALPLFTDEHQLLDAALRYGWVGADGSVSQRTLGIAEAVSYARAAGISLVAIDLVAPHAMELDDGDMELLATASRSHGPPSQRGLGRTSTSPPQGGAAQGSARPRRPSSQTYLRPASVAPPAGDGTVSATFGGSSNAGVQALVDQVPESLTDALSAVLRGYPEVEWACLVLATRGGPSEASPAVGLRVEPNFRVNLNEIIVALREAGIREGATLDVLLLDDPALIREARQVGTPFYPWKK